MKNDILVFIVSMINSATVCAKEGTFKQKEVIEDIEFLSNLYLKINKMDNIQIHIETIEDIDTLSNFTTHEKNVLVLFLLDRFL